MNDYPVHVGSMLYTQVDPVRGHEKEYNRWYERDHFYAGCMIGPWLFAGRRWVATRELKDLRFPADSPIAQPVDAGSYVAIYWVLEGKHDEHFHQWATDQVHWLYDNGRGFEHRTHVHTNLYSIAGSYYRDPDPVPIELALDHWYQGMVTVAVQRNDDVDQAAVDEWLAGAVPNLLAGSAIESCAVWEPCPLPDDAPAFVPRDPDLMKRRMLLFFLADAPQGSWERFTTLASDFEGSGLGRVVFAAPWLPTNIGTDDYVDQLW
ncbi:MAG: hypothetical protein KDB21_16280 [Acidimicrobiales bacterium]|nr:hypothetical protein [Acidimicrobiales bacterium]